jgi:hypothetical protein
MREWASGRFAANIASRPSRQWFNAEWQKLLVIDWSADSMSGGTETNFVHQPTLGARNRSGNFGIMGRLLQGIGPSGAVFVLDGGRRG